MTLTLSRTDERFEALRRQIEVELSWFGEVTVNEIESRTVFAVSTSQERREIEKALMSCKLPLNIITIEGEEHEMA